MRSGGFRVLVLIYFAINICMSAMVAGSEKALHRPASRMHTAEAVGRSYPSTSETSRSDLPENLAINLRCSPVQGQLSSRKVRSDRHQRVVNKKDEVIATRRKRLRRPQHQSPLYIKGFNCM
jgi:hypothetical protein